MYALTCDICGGRLKMGKGRIAVCESCGIEHSLERVREKIQEIKGTVHVDNAHLIANFFSIAQDAYSTENYAEAERYCNKILENSPSNCEAYLLKGKAVGWQSSISHMRFKESAICFANAVKCVSESDVSANELDSEIEEELKNLATALIKVRIDRFEKWLDNEETNGFYSDLDEMNSAIEIYEQETLIKANRNYIFSNVSSIVYNSISIISLTILLKYRLDGSKYAYQDFLCSTDNCVKILEKTADLCDDDDLSDLKIYKLVVSMIQSVIDNNTTDYQGDRWGAYREVPRLSKESEYIKKEKIKEIQRKIKRIEKTEVGL